MIRFILGAILLCVTTALGYKFADKYRYRAKVFGRLENFNAQLVSRLGFNNPTVFEEVEKLKRDLPDVIGDQSGFLRGERFACLDKKLTEEQRQIISSYINCLGTSDVAGQKQILAGYSDILKRQAEEASAYTKKISSLSVRLGFSAGLIIFVIII